MNFQPECFRTSGQQYLLPSQEVAEHNYSISLDYTVEQGTENTGLE